MRACIHTRMQCALECTQAHLIKADTRAHTHTGNERRQQCAFEVGSLTVLHFCHFLLHARVAVFLRNAKNVNVGFIHIYARKTL